ncbi:MAG: fumC [Ilumatobacteraceae bacterium]|nr:fumC [Ilumatobacteraceae bacterium]
MPAVEPVVANREPLWGRETALAIDNFPISGQPLPAAIIHALAGLKAEAARVNAAIDGTGVDAMRAEAIVAAAEEIESGALDDQFPIDVFQTGSGTSTNMNVNEVIATLASRALGAPLHPNDHVNASQSSNDVFPTAVAVAALRMVDGALRPAMQRLESSLTNAARRFATVVKTGRTHLMDAVPVTLGDEFDGYAAQIAEAAERLADAERRLGRVPLGGTAVGSGLNAPPEFGPRVVDALQRRYGIALSVAPNRFAAQGARDSVVEMSAALRGLAIALIKIANDVRWMASGPTSGLGELVLPALQAGSSIMPGKVNPVMSEMVAQVGAQVIGNDAGIAFAGSQGSFELNTYQPMMAANLLASIHLLARACQVFAERCIDGVEADAERARRIVESTPSVAAALNARLGYDRVAALVKQAQAGHRSLRDVVLADGALPAGELDELLDVARIARGNRPE